MDGFAYEIQEKVFRKKVLEVIWGHLFISKDLCKVVQVKNNPKELMTEDKTQNFSLNRWNMLRLNKEFSANLEKCLESCTWNLDY